MKVVFLCRENACRSQTAEALAKKKFAHKNVKFYSAGTEPALFIDHVILVLLKEYGINWEGLPKDISQIKKPDIVITMGCEISCPTIPGAKMIEWNIPDPRGKKVEEYRKVIKLIDKKISELEKIIK